MFLGDVKLLNSALTTINAIPFICYENPISIALTVVNSWDVDSYGY